MDFEGFKAITNSPYIPGRINQYIELTYIPTAEEVETASLKTKESLTDASFFGNYNNLIFLEKKKKTHIRKKF